MSGTVVLAAAGGALVAAGVGLLLERGLTRLVVGVLLLGNGVNLLILTAGGPAGRAPILHGGPPGASGRPMSDPVPQIMILTAIVIALASAAFVLAIAYRAGRQDGNDVVRDDIEDRRVTRGRSELRSQVRAQRREFRAWSREQRGQIRRARKELRAGIRDERRHRAVADPAGPDDDGTDGTDGASGSGGTGSGGTGPGGVAR